MQSGQDISAYYGSVGWLVDRTSPNRQILASAWLIRSQIAISCAHTLVPYMEVPDALGVDFPHCSKRYGVKHIRVHGYYDPWMAKRNFAQAPLYPPLGMAVEPMNLAALTLIPTPAPLEKSIVEKVNRIMTRIPPEEEPALAGQATNVQITSILQSLLNNRNQGTLNLNDNRNNPIAKFYLADNKVTHIRYLHLTNEEALFRLLTSHRPGQEEESYQFAFTNDFNPDWTNFNPIEKNTAGLLMNAFGRMESYQQLLQEFQGMGIVSHAVPELNLNPLPPEMRPPVVCVWNHLRHGMPLNRLLRACNFDGSIIMGALKYLRDSGQILNTPLAPPRDLQLSKLEIANNCSLERGTPVCTINLDPDTRMPVMETGFILDPFLQKGDGHYITSLGLPQSAAGCPLLVNGEVVGIHTGMISEGAEPYAEWIHPSLAISVEHVYKCMDLSPLKQTTETLAFVPAAASDRLTEEPAYVNPEFVASGSMPSLKLNESAPAVDFSETGSGAVSGTGEHKPVTAETQKQFESGAQSAQTMPLPTESGVFRKKKTGFLDSLGSMFKSKGAGNDTIEIMLLRQGLDKEKFERMDFNDVARLGDLVKLRVKLQTNSYVAVLLKRSGESEVRLVYPESQSEESQFTKGELMDIPERFTEITTGGRVKVHSGIPVKASGGLDELMIITSTQPLAVRLSELGVESIFDTMAKNIDQSDAIGTARFELRRGSLNKVDPAQASDEPSVLSACLVQVRYG